MAGLIGTGRATLAQANRGLADLSAVETQRRAARDQMEANVRSQQAAVGGIGTAVFGPKLVSGAASALKAPGTAAALSSAFGGTSAGAGAGAAGAGAASAGAGAAGAAGAAGMAAAAPWVLLALGGAYLVGKMFD